MPSNESRTNAIEQVESILGGQTPAPAPATCETGEDLPEFLRVLDKQVVYGTAC